jgi:hypothetical protein
MNIKDFAARSSMLPGRCRPCLIVRSLQQLPGAAAAAATSIKGEH